MSDKIETGIVAESISQPPAFGRLLRIFAPAAAIPIQSNDAVTVARQYRFWQQRLGRSDFVFGQFGENFTVDGLPDDDVCIGDRYRIGSALFEVTQPRTTCYRVGIRMEEPQMAALLTSTGRPGFYFRVLEEGDVAVDDSIARAKMKTR